MNANLELLRADIEDELARLAQLEQVFASVRDKLDLAPEQVSAYDRGAIGYLLHNLQRLRDYLPPHRGLLRERHRPRHLACQRQRRRFR
jgi:hypothetical protein